MNQIPEIGSLWRHKNGQSYFVIIIANKNASDDKKDEYPVTVVYKRDSDGTAWSRPLSRWHESFTEIK